MRSSVGTGIGAQYREGQARRTSDNAIRETRVRVFVEIYRVWPLILDGVAKPVKGTYPRIAAPREDQLSSASCSDQLITDQIGRESHQSEIAPALPNYFVTGRKWDQVREPLERDHVTIVHVRCDSGLQR
jgi:hypothetical protein